MNRIVIALLALLVAAPAAAQDWERVFETVPTPESGWKVLMLDPDVDRSSRERYKLVGVEDLLPAAARLVYVGRATQEELPGATGPYLRITIEELQSTGSIPPGSMVMFTGPAGEKPQGAVEILFGTEPVRPLLDRSGDPVSWADLMALDIHIAIRARFAWSLLY